MKNTYVVTKTYPHNMGLSVSFRQWRAETHCRFLHGYALQVRLRFKATKLDEKGWVINFGGLKDIKTYLEETFDHKTLIAVDDPLYAHFKDLNRAGGLDMLEVQRVGIEYFSRMVGEHVMAWLANNEDYCNRVTLMSCEIAEHDGNSVTFIPGNEGEDA